MDGNEILVLHDETHMSIETRAEDFDFQPRLVGIARLLSCRSRVSLALRYAGYRWEEIAAFFGTSVSEVKNGLKRDLQEAQSQLSPD